MYRRYEYWDSEWQLISDKDKMQEHRAARDSYSQKAHRGIIMSGGFASSVINKVAYFEITGG